MVNQNRSNKRKSDEVNGELKQESNAENEEKEEEEELPGEKVCLQLSFFLFGMGWLELST